MKAKLIPKPTINDLRALASGTYFLAPEKIKSKTIKSLFGKITRRWAKGKPLVREVDVSRTDGDLTYHYSFLCIRLKPTKPPFLPKVDLQENSYGFILLVEVNEITGIFKRGLTGFDEQTILELDSIEKKVLTRIYSSKATYEKVSLKRMTVSSSELQGCSYEAADLETTIPVLGLGRSIPRFIRLNHPDAGTVSLTPATSRIHKSGGRLTVDQLAKVVADTAACFTEPTEAGFLDAFPIPEHLSTLPAAVQPAGILFSLPSLRNDGDDNGAHFVLRREGRPDHDYTEITKRRFGNVLRLSGNETNKTFCEPGRSKGSVQIDERTISVAWTTDRQTIKIDSTGSEEPLLAWIKRNKAYSISFNSPEWFFSEGQLYKRSDFRSNIQLVLSTLEPRPSLANIKNEKGNSKAYTPKTQRFESDSLFSFVEDELCKNDNHLLCGDLNDEWADYIALSTPTPVEGCIRLIHCKAGAETSGASAFQEVIGQAIKNLGRVQLSPTALTNKIQELMNRKIWKATVPIPRYKGPGNPTESAIALIANPNTRREVLLVVTMLSAKRFKDESEKTILEPHFIQLIWILAAFVHSCREMGAKPIVVCKP